MLPSLGTGSGRADRPRCVQHWEKATDRARATRLVVGAIALGLATTLRGHRRRAPHATTVLDPDDALVIHEAERPVIPAWYRAYLERRRARIVRLHVLVAELGRLATPPAVTAPGSAAPGTGSIPAAPRS